MGMPCTEALRIIKVCRGGGDKKEGQQVRGFLQDQ